MSLWKIAWRSMQQRALASTLTGISMALGVMLVVCVLVISTVVQQSFQGSAGLGYNLLVGAKGGALQLVLNSVYYISKPVENIPYFVYKDFLTAKQRGDGVEGRYAKYVDKAIPICMGDYFREWRVIGTTTEMFDDFEYAPDRKYKFSQGRNFGSGIEHHGEGVIGADVARDAGLTIGSTFSPTHGAPDGHEHDPVEVVGILERTGTPADRALFMNIEGFYLLSGHAGEPRDEQSILTGKPAKPEPPKLPQFDENGEEYDQEFDPLPENQREVTAILVKTKSIEGAPPELVSAPLMKEINKAPFAQAVLPIREITGLFSVIVGPIQKVLLLLAILIVIVSGIGILVSIYNSMSERRHEIAVMRALGAGRSTVMIIVLLESILLSILGGLAGWVAGHAVIGLMSPTIASFSGVTISPLQFAPQYELTLIPALIALAALVGFLPALSAYRTDVGRALASSP